MNLQKSYKAIFDKYGGHYHLHITSLDDLLYLVSLADGLWMATSCPLFGLNVDPAFLKFLDTDSNGRIISDEVRSAVRWLLKCFKSSDTWTERKPNLLLDYINVDDPEGKSLWNTASLILNNLNIADATEISLEQVRNRQKIMAQADYNGDGVIPPETIKDAELVLFVNDLIAIYGGFVDASGLKGITEDNLNKFKTESESYLAWYQKGAIPEGQTETDIMPFGVDTPTMYQTIMQIREKIDQFFAQCSLVRYNPQLSDKISMLGVEITGIDFNDRNSILQYLHSVPIARLDSDGLLLLNNEINEVYRDPVNALKEKVIAKIFGTETATLSEPQWHQILTRFSAYENWLKTKPVTPLESLGVDKIQSYLSSTYDSSIREMIVIDKAVAGEVQQIQNLEKLLLYHQWLFYFVNNYVSFPCLFDATHRAIFEMGTLVMSGREFIFSVKVENLASHANLAKNSGICLIYLHVTGAGSDEKFDIAVPVTRGGTQDLYIGKRGVFFNISGKELDAQIVQIVENPISLWESLKEPFRRVYNMIGSRFAQLATTVQKESEKAITGTAVDQTSIQTGLSRVQQATPQTPATPQPTPVPPPTTPTAVPDTSRPAGNLRDIMIGVGFLAAGFGTALKFLTDTAKQLTQPKILQVLLIMIGVFITVTVLATGFTAWRKLRQRDLGVLLQASGWAINGRMRLIRPMARFFCRKARLPKGSSKHRKELLKTIERLARKMQITEKHVSD